jgi:hypothetical protein
MQLTAYAISAGKSEAEFLVGCKPFIEGYPSSSLDTIEKRYGNCRDRYRNMAANGYSHSCGGILALGVNGFKCKTCSMGQPEPEDNSPYRRFGFMAAGEMVREIRPTDWLIPDIAEAQALSQMFGDPGTYKSFMALSLCALHCNRHSMVWPANQARAGHHRHRRRPERIRQADAGLVQHNRR